MIDSLSTCLDPALAPRGIPGRAERGSRPTFRSRSLFARLRDCLEDHRDHFANLEGLLSGHVRDARHARRESYRLLLIAMLAR